MNQIEAKTRFGEALHRLQSIAKSAGISYQEDTEPFLSPAIRDVVLDFAVDLASCSDDVAARNSIERFAHGAAASAFLCIAPSAGAWLASGTVSYEEVPQAGPFFYLATFVRSYIEKSLKQSSR